MKRSVTMAAVLALSAAVGATAAPLAAHADEDMTSTISGVNALWTGSTVSVPFSFDTWDYGRVDVVVAGTQVASLVLPDFDEGTKTITAERAQNLGAAPIEVRMTSCDTDDRTDPATICTTTTTYSGTLLPTKPVPKGKANVLTLLNGLTVRSESHASSYKRSKFAVWNDANRDGENTRAEVLKAESKTKAVLNGHHTVVSGKWVSSYDGRTLTKATQVEVDHVVALAEAWRSGAWAWSAKKREAYGNDLGFGPSLAAVSKASNRAKSDDDPSAWLPSKTSAVCGYVKNWIAIKARWKLNLDVSEKAALMAQLAKCGSYAVSKPGAPVLSKLVAPAKKTKSTGSGGTSSTHGLDPRYGTCTELLRHPNHAPYQRGKDPEYYWYQDRDGDGLVCE